MALRPTPEWVGPVGFIDSVQAAGDVAVPARQVALPSRARPFPSALELSAGSRAQDQ